MEGIVVSQFFATAISEDEWKAIPSETAKKIEVLAEEKFEELITSKALSETAKFNAGMFICRLYVYRKSFNKNIVFDLQCNLRYS